MEIVVEENPREQNAYKEWVNSIERKIPTSPSHPRNPDTAIFRVPEHIRGGNENAYEPKVVSIGPYHRTREKFVDKHKLRYVRAILQRNPSKSLEDYLDGIKKLEDRARSCYRETIEIQKIESKDFVEMMFVDGCFLVELFLKRLADITEENETEDQDDIIWSDPLLASYLEDDLCLLENQLPYFILECIFESVMQNDLTTYFVKFPIMCDHFLFFKKILSSDKDASALLASLAITFIPGSLCYNVRSLDEAVSRKVSFHHLLHLFHCSLSPDPPSVETAPSKFPCLHSRKKDKPLFSVPSVTKLDDAGVKFSKAKNPGSILNINFECGVMKIPHLFIGDSTDFFFRNLIAFEQCYRQSVPRYFSMYAALMDCLINTRKDIEILSQRGIIEHGMGSDKEVALLFNRLGKGIIIDFHHPYLSILFKQVNNYYSKCWPRSRERLCRDYFSSPWSIISLIVAIILLFLTGAQTIFAFLSYLRPPS